MHKISTCVLSSIDLKLKLTQTLNTGLEAPCSKYIFNTFSHIKQYEHYLPSTWLNSVFPILRHGADSLCRANISNLQ